MKISLVSIFVDDPNKAIVFYTETLGFLKKMHMPEMALAIIVSPEDPDGTAVILEPNANFGTKEYFKKIYDANLPMIVFGATDVQAEYEKLKARGVVFRGEPKKTEWGTTVDFEDTFGNLIRLHQP